MSTAIVCTYVGQTTNKPARIKADAGTDSAILQWIDEYQKGKSGIYPNLVAREVAVNFDISLPRATDLVLRHIRQVLQANKA